jgi:predicted component of type VI protein secretion system
MHTPHPWPLGDLQAIVVAQANRDVAAERAARSKLDRIEAWDSMIPEAYDEVTGAVRSRHWFAWPAAFRASLDG